MLPINNNMPRYDATLMANRNYVFLLYVKNEWHILSECPKFSDLGAIQSQQYSVSHAESCPTTPRFLHLFIFCQPHSFRIFSNVPAG